MNEYGVIYKIENLINGKVYIGQTIKKAERRFQLHKSRLKRNVHENAYLQNAWNKYGENCFIFVVIGKYNTNELDNEEIKLIKQYKKLEKCYNLENGGNSHKELHESTKAKLSIAIKNLHKNNPEYRKKYLKTRTKRVICINTGEIFNSVIEASVSIGVNYHNVSQVVLGNNNSVKGSDGKYYQFAFYEEGKLYSLKAIRNLKEAKRVVCVNTGQIYNSTREAAEKTGVHQSKISLCCNRKRRFAGRMENGDWMVWEFEENYDSNKNYSFKKTRVQSEETRMKISLAIKRKSKL